MKRKDGIRVPLKDVEPMYLVAAHIMDKRVDAMNMISLDIPLDGMLEYVHRKRDEGQKISRLAVFLAAYLRVVAEFPELNRFVVNSKIYSRNELAVGMVVLKGSMTDGGTMSKIYFEPTDTVIDVQRKLTEYIENNRQAEPDNGTEKIIKILLSIPGLLRVGVKLFKWMDKHNLLPKAIIDVSPFHASLLITDLASIRTGAIYHHVYEFGTTSVGVAMGNTKELAKKEDGEVVLKKHMPLGVVMDERIASGSQFAMAFHKMQQYFKNPELLELPVENIHPEIKRIFHID